MNEFEFDAFYKFIFFLEIIIHLYCNDRLYTLLLHVCYYYLKDCRSTENEILI